MPDCLFAQEIALCKQPRAIVGVILTVTVVDMVRLLLYCWCPSYNNVRKYNGWRCIRHQLGGKLGQRVASRINLLPFLWSAAQGLTVLWSCCLSALW